MRAVSPIRAYGAKQPGSALAIMVVLLVALLGFLGVAIYTGLNSYLQNELQNAVSTAAGAGASAFYDDVQGGGVPLPKQTPDRALDAARKTFNNIVAANPTLTNFKASFQNGTPTTNNALDMVTVQARAEVPTPFLSPIGIDTYKVDAKATARYAAVVLPGNNLGINTKTGPYHRIVSLGTPIVDGAGPDFTIIAEPSGGGLHGYIAELCSAGKCYDVGPAAKLEGNSIVTDRNYPGIGTRRVLYGNAIFDLGATGPNYTQNVKKGAALRIVDDGVQDYIVPGSINPGVGTFERGIELDPAPTQFRAIAYTHNAVFCANETLCPVPAGFHFVDKSAANDIYGFFGVSP